MKAISLWQPYATAIAVKAKRIETRHWSTEYRGPLAIHAAKRWGRDEREFAREEIALGVLPTDIPLGAIVCTCDLIGCLPTEDPGDYLHIGEVERRFGNYAPGRFMWVLANIRQLPQPIPFKGKQGFFHVPDGLTAGVRA